jgi:hypothetical protein
MGTQSASEALGRGLHMNAARWRVYMSTLLFALWGCSSSQGFGSPGRSALVRAQPGDTVYVIEHDVLAARVPQFEQFVDSVLRPAWQRTAATDPGRLRILRQTRILRPVAPNDDGNYTYTFLLDPVVAGQAYNVLELLREVYPEEEAKQRYARFTETWARDFRSRAFVQGR